MSFVILSGTQRPFFGTKFTHKGQVVAPAIGSTKDSEMRTAIAIAAVLVYLATYSPVRADEAVIGVPVTDLGKGHKLIGNLHEPLGTVVKVQGIVVDGPFKGFEGGPNIRVQRINGKATQEDIQLPLKNETFAVKPDELSKIEPRIGKTYELQGYESGGFVGHPSAIWKDKRGWIQTTNHHFSLRFYYVRGKMIPAVKDSPREFEGRRALFQGVASNDQEMAIMEGDGWSIIVNPKSTWPKQMIGKRVETLGTYDRLMRDTDNAPDMERYVLLDGSSRPVSLEDQLGQEVELRGRAWSSNDIWRFQFRETEMYVENLNELPGWSDENRGRAVLIRGILEKAKLPSLEQGTPDDPAPKPRDYFIVRKASWAPTEPLLGPERFDED
jgi:hypothetical protein